MHILSMIKDNKIKSITFCIDVSSVTLGSEIAILEDWISKSSCRTFEIRDVLLLEAKRIDFKERAFN